MKCDTDRPKKVKGKKQSLKQLQTFSSCQSIRDAAQLRNDADMLLKIADQDLIVKEFKMHPVCYKEYVRICSKQSILETDASTNEADKKPAQSSTDFESVSKFIEHFIIDGKQFVSMTVLAEMYGLDHNDERLRFKLKQKLEKEFADKLFFVTVAYHEPQIVVSRAALAETSLKTFVRGKKSFVSKEAASILRCDIQNLIENAPEIPWPPTVDSLWLPDRQPPNSVKDFLSNFIHSTHHSPGEEVVRYVDSFSQDLIHAVSKGNFLTMKHVLLGTGLHSLTGQKKPIELLGRFGHSINYDKVRLIETAQAELIQKLRSLQQPLPLLPANDTDRVLTFFWWDNFDVKKENLRGGLHTTHGIAYQVETPGNMTRCDDVEVPKSGRRSITCEEHHLPSMKIVPHKNPELFQQDSTSDYNGRDVEKLLLLWKLMRRNYSTFPQCISRFVGWVVLALGVPHSQETEITFLPPINNPITDYSTVLECIRQSQSLAATLF
eukprot:Seg6008.1 transcript_id=Seg6008.1/GoldUCD/mRNA.D3Y31 product="hypothetical protein" protein_id=Seg6008.1/GoldUCD/D3Y31